MNAILARSRWNFLPAKNLAENHWNLAEISPTSPRSRLSRRDDRDLGEISLNFHARKKSRRELLKSRRDLGNLAEISAISPKSRRDLAEIFTRERGSITLFLVTHWKSKRRYSVDSSQDIMTKLPLKDYQNAQKLSTDVFAGRWRR